MHRPYLCFIETFDLSVNFVFPAQYVAEALDKARQKQLTELYIYEGKKPYKLHAHYIWGKRWQKQQKLIESYAAVANIPLEYQHRSRADVQRPGPEWVTPSELAKKRKVPISTVQSWIDRKMVEYTRIGYFRYIKLKGWNEQQ